VIKRKDKKYIGQRLTPTGHAGRPFCILWSLLWPYSSNSGVLGNGCPIHCIDTFLYYRSTFLKGAHYFHRVCGLVMLKLKPRSLI